MGVPIVQADLVDEEFLRKYAERVENVGLRQIRSGVIELMTLADGQRWAALESCFEDLGIIARAVSFSPPEMLATVVRKADYDTEQLIGQVLDGSRSLTEFMLQTGRDTPEAYSLCFNVANPVIQRLAEYDGDENVLRTILLAINAGALIAGGVELSMELSREITRAQARMLELILEQEDKLRTVD